MPAANKQHFNHWRRATESSHDASALVLCGNDVIILIELVSNRINNLGYQ